MKKGYIYALGLPLIVAVFFLYKITHAPSEEDAGYIILIAIAAILVSIAICLPIGKMLNRYFQPK